VRRGANYQGLISSTRGGRDGSRMRSRTVGCFGVQAVRPGGGLWVRVASPGSARPDPAPRPQHFHRNPASSPVRSATAGNVRLTPDTAASIECRFFTPPVIRPAQASNFFSLGISLSLLPVFAGSVASAEPNDGKKEHAEQEPMSVKYYGASSVIARSVITSERARSFNRRPFDTRLDRMAKLASGNQAVSKTLRAISRSR